MKNNINWCKAMAAVIAVLFLCPYTVCAAGMEGSCFYIGKIPIVTEDESLTEDEIYEDRDLEEGDSWYHWNLGDTIVREIGGREYRFRCIDQNYWDTSENHRQCALFLCDTVIPANLGSEYTVEELEDGSHGYVFHAGPVTSFGDSNEYKYSRIRRWLNEVSLENLSMAESVQTGISYAYTGKTGEGLYDQLVLSDLTSAYIGSQTMTDQLFILSVDEALRYRSWLWRFEGSERQNPQSQIDEFCKGYWLRNPVGTSGNYDTDQVYIVDLVQGNIRPEWISVPASGNTPDAADEEVKQTVTIGVRPAFALPQERE